MTIVTGALLGIAMLLAGCASKPQAVAEAEDDEELFPSRIQEWLDANQETTYQGIGVSAIEGNESFALRESTTIALGELARNMEARVAAVNTNIAQRNGGGKAVEATKQRTDRIVSAAKTFGPVKGKGNIYTIKYISTDDFNRGIKEAVQQQEVAITEAELDELLRQ
jgi:hypothetical protein